jgi:hypothetical protein
MLDIDTPDNRKRLVDVARRVAGAAVGPRGGSG